MEYKATLSQKASLGNKILRHESESKNRGFNNLISSHLVEQKEAIQRKVSRDIIYSGDSD